MNDLALCVYNDGKTHKKRCENFLKMSDAVYVEYLHFLVADEMRYQNRKFGIDFKRSEAERGVIELHDAMKMHVQEAIGDLEARAHATRAVLYMSAHDGKPILPHQALLAYWRMNQEQREEILCMYKMYTGATA